MSYVINNPGDITTGFEFFISNFEHVLPRILEVQYSELLWPTVIPAQAIDTGVDAGTRVISQRVMDLRGAGAFVGKSNQIPTVEMSLDSFQMNVSNSGISGRINRQDMREFRMGFQGMSLDEKIIRAMRSASERHIERVFFFGDDLVGYDGFIDFPNVPVTTAALNAAMTSTLWINKTPDEILFDINDAITTVWTQTRQLFNPDTVLIPPAQLAALSAGRITNFATDSILNYIQKNNIYTQQTGRELFVTHNRYLQGAGMGGTDRMRVMTTVVNDERPNWYMAMPMPINFLTPQQNQMDLSYFAEYIFGPVFIRYPESQLSVDGI